MPPSPVEPGVAPLEVALRPHELLAAWRADVCRLLVATREPLRPQQRVSARVTVVGPGACATIGARVVSVVRHSELVHAELAPDEVRVRALERLLAVARGEPAAYAPRAPRLLATLPAVVQGVGAATYMNTFSVSENGCGLAWSGPAPVPPVGAPMSVRLGAGSRAAQFRGIVCWTGRSGRAATVGVRFVAGATTAWGMVLGDLRRSGAPPA